VFVDANVEGETTSFGFVGGGADEWIDCDCHLKIPLIVYANGGMPNLAIAGVLVS
jgi:hypothetical protein